MMEVTIISVGTIKESFWREAIAEYLKRLHPFVKIKTVEVPEEKISSVTDRKRIISAEGKKIIKVIPPESYVVALDRAGKLYSTMEWVEHLDEWSKFGKSITFVIGGPLGLSPDILQKASVLLSLAKMTFTHQMTRVILLEQLYRAGMIQRGGAYHY